VGVPAVVSACVGVVPAEVVGEVLARVPVKVAQVTTLILRGEGARILRRSCQKSEVAVRVSAVASACEESSSAAASTRSVYGWITTLPLWLGCGQVEVEAVGSASAGVPARVVQVLT
jgi:hypothetical protein